MPFVASAEVEPKPLKWRGSQPAPRHTLVLDKYKFQVSPCTDPGHWLARFGDCSCPAGQEFDSRWERDVFRRHINIPYTTSSSPGSHSRHPRHDTHTDSKTNTSSFFPAHHVRSILTQQVVHRTLVYSIILNGSAGKYVARKACR